ncbi:MAG: YjgP/YjgQ family permease, partial [Chitinophagia bacterium]|nr:YjgP/YjgQ family permease [Chitinophagia bacterium]
QFFWLYMDELIGKGVDMITILTLMVYIAATLVPLALPLGLLLSSIMTFGNMGESYELVAIKSAGISLFRFIRPLFWFIVLLTFVAFFFNNNVIPIANLKALSLLYDVRNSKPTLEIKPDRFNNDIKGFSIRVGSKDPDGQTIHDVLIYDHTDLVGNNKIITAKEGKMIPTPDKQALIFRLKDGWRYEEGYENGTRNKDLSQTRMHFEEWDKVFDLSAFNFTRTSQEMFKNAFQMMDVKQLHDAMDSLKRTHAAGFKNVSSYLSPYYTLGMENRSDTELQARKLNATAPPKIMDSGFIKLVPPSKRLLVVQNVCNNIRNVKTNLDNCSLLEMLQRENLSKFGVEFHKKFALSFACILLFLIGAPLGAIIRKGGIGLPLVFAVVFFITFHMLNITGEKLVKSNTLPPWGGMWMSTFLLMPIAIWLTFTARNDSQIFNKDWYLRILLRLQSLISKKPIV